MKPIIETNVLFQDNEIFGDTQEHSYTVSCYDGYGVAMKEDKEDTCPYVVYLVYPKRKDVDEKLAYSILKYRGLTDLTPNDITYGDIMMKCGKLQKLPF